MNNAREKVRAANRLAGEQALALLDSICERARAADTSEVPHVADIPIDRLRRARDAQREADTGWTISAEEVCDAKRKQIKAIIERIDRQVATGSEWSDAGELDAVIDILNDAVEAMP